jgi:hypothetical protein
MKLTTKQKWLRTIAWMRRNFPARYPVYVRSRQLKAEHGYTIFADEFLLCINNKQSFPLRIDTLIHEWAHALTWFGAETHEDHSAEWGLAYAKIYRLFVEWNFGRKKNEKG